MPEQRDGQTQVDRIASGRRLWRERFWLWRPQWHWFGWTTLSPIQRGGDEYDWHTIVLGWTITGRIIFAVRPCPGTGRCAEDMSTRPPAGGDDRG